MTIFRPFQMLLKMGLIDLDLQGHLGRTITHKEFKLLMLLFTIAPATLYYQIFMKLIIDELIFLV